MCSGSMQTGTFLFAVAGYDDLARSTSYAAITSCARSRALEYGEKASNVGLCGSV